MDVGRALSRLIRPERSLVLQLLQDQPLTVADILASAQIPEAARGDSATRAAEWRSSDAAQRRAQRTEN